MRASAQRTAVKQRPHQETERHQVATSEPVVHHHGREGAGCRWRRGAAGCFNGLLGGLAVVITWRAAVPPSRHRYADAVRIRRRASEEHQCKQLNMR